MRILNFMLRKFKRNLDSNTLQILEKSFETMIVKVLGMAVGFLISIIIARELGPDGVGIINLGNQVISITLTFCLLGIPAVITKETSISFSRKNWRRIHGNLHIAVVINGLVTAFVAFFGFFLSEYLSDKIFNEHDLAIPLSILFVGLFPQVLSRIVAAAINGIGRIWQSSLAQESLTYYFLIILFLASYIIDVDFTVKYVAYSYAIARIGVFIITSSFWIRFNENFQLSKEPVKPLLKVSLPLLLSSAVNILSASVDTIMLGWLLNAKSLGYYSIALKIALMSSFVLQVSNNAIMPKVASMFANGKIHELEEAIQNITKGLFLFSVVSLIMIVLCGKPVLGIWGEEFKSAYASLVILSIAQGVNISAGCVGLLLTMCGQEKIWGKMTILFAIVNIILNYNLIVYFDTMGAAIATAISMVFQNIVGYYLVKKRLGIRTFSIRKIWGKH